MQDDGGARDRERVQAFGRRVRDLRQERDLSQEQLAERAGLHRAVVGFIERAEREVGITTAWRLADGLKVTLAEMVDGLGAAHGGSRPEER